MRQVICDYCGAAIKEDFLDYRCKLNETTTLTMNIKTKKLCLPERKIQSPDICRDCIIKALQDKT